MDGVRSSTSRTLICLISKNKNTKVSVAPPPVVHPHFIFDVDKLHQMSYLACVMVELIFT